MREAIEEDVLRALIEGRGVSDFKVTRVGDKYGFSVRYTSATRWLPVRSRRENVRTWASLTAVGRFAESMGIRSFTVEL